MSQKSRAGYFRDRRAKFKAFHVEVEKERMAQLEKRLAEQNLSKKECLERKNDEELSP